MIFPVVVESINGLRSRKAGGIHQREGDPGYYQLVRTLTEIQQSGAVSMRIVRGKRPKRRQRSYFFIARTSSLKPWRRFAVSSRCWASNQMHSNLPPLTDRSQKEKMNWPSSPDRFFRLWSICQHRSRFLPHMLKMAVPSRRWRLLKAKAVTSGGQYRSFAQKANPRIPSQRSNTKIIGFGSIKRIFDPNVPSPF